MSLTKVTQSMIDAPFGNVKNYGAKGDNLTDDSAAIQAAVDDICDASGILYFPPGSYRLKTAITFPNKSFIIAGCGPTSTFIAADPTTPSITLFDFTGCNGPAKRIQNLSFNGPALSVYGGTAVKAHGNGFLFDNCWFRGIGRGIDASGSFINTVDCVAEFCFVGAYATALVVESLWTNWTHYKNETDFRFDAADNKSFIVRDATCIATKTEVVRSAADNMMIDGIVVQDDGTGYTPNIIRLIGNASGNIINNVKATSFGNFGVFFEGAGVTDNRLTNIDLYDVANGVLFSACSNNQISGLKVTDCASGYAVFFDTAPNNKIEDFEFVGNDYGVRIFAAERNQLYNGRIRDSVTADFLYPTNNTERIYTSNVLADFSAIASLTNKVSVLSGGQNQVLRSAAPVSGTWAVGDICINSSPAIGSPKGWRCTVAGTPGTWVSEGNL